MSSSPETWEAGALSETGSVREENQDRMCSLQVEVGRLDVVADGMGGHKGGAVAAQLTVDGLCHHLDKVSRNASIASIDVELKHAFDQTNRTIYEKAHSGAAEIQGMGSTAVVF